MNSGVALEQSGSRLLRRFLLNLSVSFLKIVVADPCLGLMSFRKAKARIRYFALPEKLIGVLAVLARIRVRFRSCTGPEGDLKNPQQRLAVVAVLRGDAYGHEFVVHEMIEDLV